jgi:hypothetical protein
MNKLNLPDEIWPGREGYSLWKDLQVNGWLMVAALVSGATDIVFRSAVRAWPVGWQVVIALVPFVAILLWARSLLGWVRGMDELHQRITLSTVLFSTGASFFVVMLWNRLVSAGVFGMLAAKEGASWDIGTVAHVFLLLLFFYILGSRIFNRRYA